MTNSSTVIEFGSTTITVPESCPQPDLFKALFLKIMAARFGSQEKAAKALAQWKSVRIVPQPFAGHPEAEQFYRRARLALDPEAQAWEQFEDALFSACLAYDEDGRAQTPAIPGWSPDWTDLAA